MSTNFQRIYETEFNYVWNFLRRMGIAERDLKDKAQDVFEVVYRTLDRYDPSRPIRPWITGITFRVASNHRRAAWRHQEVSPERMEFEDRGPNPERALQDKELRHLLLRALEKLDLDRCAVIVLHDLEGFSIPDIGEMLEVNIATLYSRLRKGRQELVSGVKRMREAQRRRG